MSKYKGSFEAENPRRTLPEDGGNVVELSEAKGLYLNRSSPLSRSH